MLSELVISNLAIIDNAQIAFKTGLNVLTGETGAGKSLIIDSINTVLGARTSTDLIRNGASSLRVEALFYVSKEDYPETDGEIILSREVFSDGRNSCRINGRMATLAELREIGQNLISIHGQNDSQRLLKPSLHLEFIDNYAKNQDILKEYSELYKNKKEIQKQIEHLNSLAENEAKRLDYLKFCLDEISAANLTENEDAALIEERNVLRSFEKIKDGVDSAVRTLLHDNGALDLMNRAISELPQGISEELDSLRAALYDTYYSAKEATREIEYYKDNLSGDASRLENVEERLDVISKLKSKYGGSIEEVLAFAKKAEKDVLEIENKDEELSECTKQLSDINKKLEKLAENLTEKRKQAALRIESEVLSELSDLDMAYVKFAVKYEEVPLCSHGKDKMEFLVSTTGDELKPLAKIASGGEMSRICLALKTILTDKDKAETVIFDEIDSGISGIAAQRIGKKLKTLGKKCQVISITHLAQIASKADQHFCILKQEQDGRFKTNVTTLDYDGRLYELARIIGGEKITPATKAAAEEMLKD